VSKPSKLIQVDTKKFCTDYQMPATTEELLKESCKQLIEEKLGWGSSVDWTNRDFDLLSDKIYEDTGVNLSQTTLKRIWGKVKYDSLPTVTTLNTLARFLGFEHWRDFRQKQGSQIFRTDTHQPILETPPAGTPANHRKFFWITSGALLLSIITILSWNLFSLKAIGKKNAGFAAAYQFSSKKIVSRGLPNSVVFEYDATASPEDSVFIQQSWDINLRALVPKNQHLYTSIYYYPGFFKAKLLAGGKIVKEHDVFIQTDGWLCLAEHQPVPVYFKKEDGIERGRLELSIEKLKSQNVEMKPTAPYVFYGNIREFGDLRSDNFILETSLKNEFPEGSGVCQKSEIRLLCEGSMVSIPLSAKGCISENNLFCLGHFKKGTENDLSGFGVDFNHFVKVRLEVRDAQAKFFVDDKMVYHIGHITFGSKIKGIVYRFQGTGSVDWVKLSKGDGTPVYDEEF
jgi:hypothetical protein